MNTPWFTIAMLFAAPALAILALAWTFIDHRKTERQLRKLREEADRLAAKLEERT